MKTIYMIEPKTEEVREWVDENVGVPDYMWMGPRFAVEARYVDDLIHGMAEAGFSTPEDFEVL